MQRKENSSTPQQVSDTYRPISVGHLSPVLIRWLVVSCILIAGNIAYTAPKTDWEWYQQRGDKSAKWDSLVKSGFEAFDNGNFNTAITFLSRARGKGTKDGLVFHKIATYYEIENELGKALTWLEKASIHLKQVYLDHPTTKNLSDHFGTIYFLGEKWDEALPYFEEAIKNQGENFMRLFLAGQIFMMKENWSTAANYFERALKHNPPPETKGQPVKQAWIEWMKATYQMGNHEQTLTIANKVLEFEPGNPLALDYKQRIGQDRYKKHEREILEKIVQ